VFARKFRRKSVKYGQNQLLLLKKTKNFRLSGGVRTPTFAAPSGIVMGKSLETIIKQRLMIKAERRRILPKHQGGFRLKKSTLHNIVRLQRYAMNNL
jgi:hypothetical protein